ncbi:MAG: hypothetical protein GY750_20430 [Lentisphaerae bacterium]|nr:hypothetical protein [Lentisphaerota bacterium]MCP4103762.1 hypothetical protein [Lentisphaerota bacterium]
MTRTAKVVERVLLGTMLTVACSLFAEKAEQFYRQRADKVLNEVWNTVSRLHYDQNFSTKYNNVFKKYKAHALSCRNDKALALVLNNMLRSIGQSHVLVLPPVGGAVSKALAAAYKSTAPLSSTHTHKVPSGCRDLPADVGIRVALSSKKILVTRVRPDSSAAKAGVKMGWALEEVNGIKIKPEQKYYVGWPILVRSMLAGRPGTQVSLSMIDRGKSLRKIKVVRNANGASWFKLGVMPRSFSTYQSELLKGNIGYIRFTAFFPEMISKCKKDVVGKFSKVKGLVIDMRGNIGGMALLPSWLASWVSKKVVSMGTLKLKGAKLTPKSYPQNGCYKGPLVVLIDRNSYSSAEIFSAAMQDGKAAKLFGTRTSGKCLPSSFMRLKSGFRLQTIMGDYLRPSGGEVERVGVKPDVKVQLNVESLCKGIDNVKEAAREYLVKLRKK